ncbi:hypothetical protein ACHAWO_006581 [Cyclotella atomus]|uniref:Protein kinase domain-containing protein n=1 Tax=Cyclotella atomus TaxID=382360 RepID=A0ABD3NHB3_9STRA
MKHAKLYHFTRASHTHPSTISNHQGAFGKVKLVNRKDSGEYYALKLQRKDTTKKILSLRNTN